MRPQCVRYTVKAFFAYVRPHCVRYTVKAFFGYVWPQCVRYTVNTGNFLCSCYVIAASAIITIIHRFPLCIWPCVTTSGASSPLCSTHLGRGWVRQNTTVFVSYLLRWRHVSATVGHPQVTKCTMRKTIQCMIVGCGKYSKLSMRSRRSVYPYWINIQGYS